MGNEKRFEIPQELQKSGERILWCGCAEPCKLLEGKDKPRIIRHWIITCIAFAVLFALYLSSAAEKSGALLIGFAVVMAVILASPYMEWRRLKTQTYWVTDQRIISCIGSYDFCEIEMGLVDAVDVKKLSSGNDCVLLCKKIVDEGEKHLRWRSSSPVSGSVAGEVGMLFYNIADAEGVLAAIRSVKADV